MRNWWHRFLCEVVGWHKTLIRTSVTWDVAGKHEKAEMVCERCPYRVLLLERSYPL